jgi:hypothetical protein
MPVSLNGGALHHYRASQERRTRLVPEVGCTSVFRRLVGILLPYFITFMLVSNIMRLTGITTIIKNLSETFKESL